MSGRIRFACLLALGCALTLALASTAVAVPNKFDDYVRTPAEDVLGDPIGTAPSATIEAVTADALGNLYYTETDFFTA
ncbi:MAG: hypothetical protein HY876_04165, partial [Coriobacteriales bacterium]|nr:hypothetical protein [Coriobacteriales bacterium]